MPFTNLLIVVAIGLAVPLLLGLAPRVRVPAAVFEIAVGIIIGPSVLGIAVRDTTVTVMAVLGLAFLLFLGGMEIEVDRLRGARLRGALLAFGLSLGLAIVVGGGLAAAGLVDDPILVAVILLATSLGVVVPVLKDAGEAGTPLGQQVIAGASIADFGAIILLTLLFGSGVSAGPGASVDGGRVAILVVFAGAAVLLARLIIRAERLARLARLVAALGDTTAQIRVRATVVLLVGLVALAQVLGLELILGAFIAGIVVAAVDRDELLGHPQFRPKLEAIGFGVVIPVFFVSSGMTLDVGSLLADPSDLVLVPLFLGALLAVRGLPAVLLRPSVGGRGALAAGLLQATSLPFIVAATQIGIAMGTLEPSVASALVAAGLASVLLFPAGALALLERRQAASTVSPGTALDRTPDPSIGSTPEMM